MVIVTPKRRLSVGSVRGCRRTSPADLFKSHPRIHRPVVLRGGHRVGHSGRHQRTRYRPAPGCRASSSPWPRYSRPRRRCASIANGKQIDPTSIPRRSRRSATEDISTSPGFAIVVVIVVAIVALRDAILPRRPRPLRHRVEPEAAALAGVPSRRAAVVASWSAGAPRGLRPASCSSQSSRRWTRPAGTGYEFKLLRPVVVGGVAIFGGSGTVLAWRWSTVAQHHRPGARRRAKVSAFWNQAVAGALLLAAITFDRC